MLGDISRSLEDGVMPIVRNGSNPAVTGPAASFTGSVRIETPFSAIAPGRVAGAIVTFEPGARTAWHTHPARASAHHHVGSRLDAARGRKRDHHAAGRRRAVSAECSTLAWCHADNVVHARRDRGSTRRKSVEWMEHVTDEQYLAGKNAVLSSDV